MIYLIEVEAHDGTGVITLYYGTDGLTTKPTDTPANTYYDPRILDPGNFEQTLFGQGTTRGATSSGGGDVVLASGDPGNGVTLDALLNYGFDGRNITIKMLDGPDQTLSTATTLFSGTCEQLAYSNAINKLSIVLHNRLDDLDKPLLTAVYLGTTVSTGPTAEGNVDLKDQLKPRVWGVMPNVPGVETNAFDLIYQFSDSPVISLTVCDGSYPLTNAGDFATIAALQAWTQIPGRYATCLAQGSARLGAKAFKAVTADVVEGTTAADRTAAQVVRRMLLFFGMSPLVIPAASFTALDVLNSAQVGIHVNDDRTTLTTVMQVLDSIGGWISPDRLGVFKVGRLERPSGTSVAEFGDTEFLSELELLPVLDDNKGVRSWRTSLKWGRVGLVQGNTDIFEAVSTARRTLVATEWREAKSENAAIKVIHPAAAEIEIETCLAYEADAIAEALRRQTFYGSQLQRFKFKVHVSVAYEAQLGAIITLRTARLGLAAGKLFVVIGRVDEYVTNTVTLDVLG